MPYNLPSNLTTADLLLFNSNPLPCLIVEKELLKICAANESAATFFKHINGFILKTSFPDLFKKESKEQLLQNVQSNINARYWKEEAEMQAANGNIVILELLGSGITIGVIEYFQIICIDVTPKFLEQQKWKAEKEQYPVFIDQKGEGGTERKQTNERLNLLATLVEETADVLTAADLEFKPLTWNKAAEKIYGLTADQVIGKNLRQHLHLIYNNATQEEVRNTISAKGEWRGEMHFIRPTDKKPVTLLANFKILKNENGHPIGHVIAGTDITERKEAELKQEESEKRFRDVADSAPVMIWMSDAENKTIYVNKPWTDFTGLSTKMLAGTSWVSIVHPDDVQQAIKEFNTNFTKLEAITMIYRLKKETGEYRWVLDTGIPRKLNNGIFLGYIGSVVDINDQKIKEDQLRYQATILENVLDIVVTADLNFIVKSWNRFAEELYGFKEEHAIGKHFEELVQYQFINDKRIALLEALKTNGIWKGEIVYKNKQGALQYFVHSITYVYNEKGEKIGIMSVGRDITDRKEAEEKLKKSELFYRSLTADSRDGMLLMDDAGIIRFASPAVAKILGHDPEELIGKNGFGFVHPADQGWASQSFQREVAEQPEIKSISVRLLHKNGKWLWCSTRGFNMLQNPYVNSIVVYFHDDSLRKKANDALKASEQRFRTLISDIQIGVILYDANGKLILCNKFISAIFNTTEQKLVNKDIYDIITETVHEDGRKFLVEERPLYKALKYKKTNNDVVMGIKLVHNTDFVWLLVNTQPILDRAGNIIHIISSLKDITERKKLEEKLMSEQINQQKALTQATIDGQEKERLEIGKELHDNIGQQLTTIKLYLDLACSSADDSGTEMVNLALKNVTGVINEIRGMSRALVPQTLGDLGLIDSIIDLVETVNRTKPLIIEINNDDFREEQIPENQKLMLFRIIQEGLNNIIKHANASNVSILLRNNKQKLLLQITDNGQGFDGGKTKKSLGLINIKNRAELFGGTAEIKSAAGSGCTIKVIIPQQVYQLYQ